MPASHPSIDRIDSLTNRPTDRQTDYIGLEERRRVASVFFFICHFVVACCFVCVLTGIIISMYFLFSLLFPTVHHFNGNRLETTKKKKMQQNNWEEKVPWISVASTRTDRPTDRATTKLWLFALRFDYEVEFFSVPHVQRRRLVSFTNNRHGSRQENQIENEFSFTFPNCHSKWERMTQNKLKALCVACIFFVFVLVLLFVFVV